VETWYIGYQCLECPTGVFHCHDDQCYAEIIDEETGAPCGPGETGLMVATPFTRRLTPIVRYRVGDRASWIEGGCPCGRTTPRFKLLGRGDDVLRIGFDSVDYAFVQSAAERVGGLHSAIQMEKRRKDGRDELIVRAETSMPLPARGELAERLAAGLAGERPTLREAVSSGTIWPIRVELFDVGALPTNPRTGKLVRVIDATQG
jgi:phenylacetate-coenzyme A ligase PaaK-like adenylate-forming protein